MPHAGPDVPMATSSSWVAWDHPAFCTESPARLGILAVSGRQAGVTPDAAQARQGAAKQSGHVGLAYWVLCKALLSLVSPNNRALRHLPGPELAGQLLHPKAAAAVAQALGRVYQQTRPSGPHRGCGQATGN